MNSRGKFTVAMAALLLAACATPSIPPGAAMGDVQAKMGKPVDVVTAPDGDTVWQYPTGVYGQRTYMVRFGKDQRVTSFSQAMTWDNIAKIHTGMTRDEIRLALGPPIGTVFYRNLGEDLWWYRYHIPVNDNRIFNVSFDAKSGLVKTTSDLRDEAFHPINMGTGSGTGR